MKAASNIQVGATPEFVTIQTVGRRSRYMSYTVTPTDSTTPTAEAFGITGPGQTSLATGLVGNVHCEGYQQIGIKVTGPSVVDVDLQFD